MAALDLRVRLAVMLGLPLLACRTAPAPVADREISEGDERAAGSGVIHDEPSGAAFLARPRDATAEKPPLPTEPTTSEPTPPTCQAVEVPEHVCGTAPVATTDHIDATAPYSRCPRDVAQLVQIQSGESWDREGFRSASGPDWRWNVQTSIERTMTNDSELSCCYDRCATLPVAPTPRVRGHLAKGQHEFERCVTLPLNGHCPAGLWLTLTYAGQPPEPSDAAPLVRSSATTCCYSVATAHPCAPDLASAGDCH